MTLPTYVRFFCAGLLRSDQTGAIVPSQRFLVEKMISPIPGHYSGHVLELGAGTGALTTRLAQKCPFASISACEINPVLARDLRANLNRAGINGQVKVMPEPAEHLLARLDSEGATRPEFIISGIPLCNVPREQTYALIRQIERTLAPGGMYIQFQHSLVDQQKIRAAFDQLRTVPVLLNFPPAFVYYASKRAAP